MFGHHLGRARVEGLHRLCDRAREWSGDSGPSGRLLQIAKRCDQLVSQPVLNRHKRLGALDISLVLPAREIVEAGGDLDLRQRGDRAFGRRAPTRQLLGGRLERAERITQIHGLDVGSERGRSGGKDVDLALLEQALGVLDK